jgi:hypothetical protein
VAGITTRATNNVENVAMNWRLLLICGLIAVSLWHACQQWASRAVHPPDGQIAPYDPLQTSLDDAAIVRLGHWQLKQRARYDITARILSREDYSFDPLAALAPEDLALGWGPMSDNRVLKDFEITQSARFYSWRPRGALPIARQEVIEHSANTHVIPTNEMVRAQLKRLRVGQVVHLRGTLVDGVRDDGAYVNTSLTRSDSGAGSCEIVLVDSVESSR